MPRLAQTEGQCQCRGHRARWPPHQEGHSHIMGRRPQRPEARRVCADRVTGSRPWIRQSCWAARRLPLLPPVARVLPRGPQTHADLIAGQPLAPAGPSRALHWKFCIERSQEEGFKGTHPSLHGVCWRVNLELTGGELIAGNSLPRASQTLGRR